MGLKFWQGSRRPQQLSSRLLGAIRERFEVSDDEVSRLCSVDKPGKFVGRAVTNIRVYDPTLVAEDGGVSSYADLDRHPGAIRFHGHEEQGQIMLTDRRQAASAS